MENAISEFMSLKSRLDTFEKNFNKCAKANRTKGYLEGRLKGLKELWSEICEVDSKINSYQTENNANIDYFENDELGVTEEKYFELVGSINEHLNAYQNPNLNHLRANQSKIKLAKISLPTFSGSYHEWISFKNRFTNLIHDSADLSNGEKLEYLKSCVTGEAEWSIRRYQITDQNYDLAWKQLNEKYDNKRMLQITQIEWIIDQSDKTESAKEIRELIDVTQGCLEALKNLGVDSSTWDIMLIVLITRKLPLRTRELWEEELEPVAEVPTFKQLCKFLKKRCRTLKSLELIGGSEAYKDRSQDVPIGHSQSAGQRNNCLVCNNGHHSILVCDKFLNMPPRKRSAFVNAKEVCRNCLEASHKVEECKSSKRCFTCCGKHHTLLHREERDQWGLFSPNPEQRVYGETYIALQSHPNNTTITDNCELNHIKEANPACQFYISNQSQQNLHDTQNSRMNQIGQPINRRTYTTTSNSQSIEVISSNLSQRVTLFPTAIIKVMLVGGRLYNLRALLDQCSDEAYIKKSVAKMLGLKVTDLRPFNVTCLGASVATTINEVVNFKMIIDPDESMNVNANVVKTLVGVLPNAKVVSPKNLLKNIKLADSNFAKPGNVDVMLGAKQFTELILSGVLKEDGYVVQNTKLGWIVSGRGDTGREPIKTSTCSHITTSSKTDSVLKRFCEMEKPPQKRNVLKKCEEILKKSYRRTVNGSVQVRLPFKENPTENFRASRNLALARWTAKKLDKEPGLKQECMDAMQEYSDLGHMARVATSERDGGKGDQMEVDKTKIECGGRRFSSDKRRRLPTVEETTKD